MKVKTPKKAIALLAVALLLLGSGGYMGTRATLQIFSDDYLTDFQLSHIDVSLVENGDAEVATKPADDGDALVLYLKHGIDPGRVYKEEIAAKNPSDMPEYVRLTLRTYWGELRDGEIQKDPTLDPSLIELAYDGDEYNSDAWAINKAESTNECRTFYLKKALAGGETSPVLVNQLRLNQKVMEAVDKVEQKVGNKTITTYVYEYDGRMIFVDADVQAVQTHNGTSSIRSVWGVQNVIASAGENGTLTVE
jgi:hypothetical protein